MEKIIEKLYYIYSEENSVYKNAVYQAAFNDLSSLFDDIGKLLPEEDKIAMLDELYALMSKMMLAESKAMFAGGFKTAMEIISECL